MKKIFALLLSCACFITYGQEAKVKVKNVAIDSMSWPTHSEYTLTLEVKKPKVDKTRKVRLAEAKAISNTQELPLCNHNRADDYFDSDYFKDGLENTVPLTLWATDTIIRKIDTIRGTLHYLEPTLENGGIQPIADPLSKTGSNLVDGITNETKVILIHPATLIMNGRNYEKAILALEDNNELPRGTLKSEVDNFMADAGTPDFENLYLYYISGNPEKIAKIDFFDASTHKFWYYGKFGVKKRDGFHVRFVYFKKKPAPDWKMDIYMETEASVTKYDFILTDVKMPFKN